MKNKQILSVIMLFFGAMIWGLAFVAQSEGMKSVGTFTFAAARSLLAVIFLAILSIVTDAGKKRKLKKTGEKPKPFELKMLLLGGTLCGVALFFGTITQQTGLIYTTVGKSGFITALYMIFVPLVSVFLRRKVSPLLWVSVLIALGGMYLLCMSGADGINKGDLYTLACALGFTFHIMLVDKFSPLTDSIKLSCAQFAVCGVISAVCMLIFEEPTVAQLKEAAIPIIYAGTMSSGVAFTLQIMAQKHISPVIATLIMSLESVFAAIFGWIILDQKLSPAELTGCALVFAAIILTQIDVNALKNKLTKKKA